MNVLIISTSIYSVRAGASKTRGQNLDDCLTKLSNYSKFYETYSLFFQDLLTQKQKGLTLTLCSLCQGQPRVVIFIKFVERQSEILHAKFQDLRLQVLLKIFKCFTIYGRGGHLGHVTYTIYKSFV